jgi:hypothetical protein
LVVRFRRARSIRSDYLADNCGLLLCAALVLQLATGARAARAACVGDCDGDGTVAVNELISGVNVSLGAQPLPSCPAFDSNDDQQVTIDELLAAVNNALAGCVADQIAAQVESNMLTVGDADEFFRHTNPDDPIADRMGATADFVLSQAGVSEVSPFPTGLALFIRHSNGLESALMLMPDFNEDATTVPEVAAATNSSPRAHIAAGDVPTTAILIEGRDLKERLTTFHYPHLETALHKMGFGIGDANQGVARLAESGYTTDFFRTQLGKYQIIYVIGHGGNDGTKSGLASGSLGPAGASFPAPTGADATDLSKNLLLTAITSPGFITRGLRFIGYDSAPKPRYVVTAAFIANYYKADKRLARDSLVYIDGCNLLPDLPRAFADAGAAAVLYFPGNTVDTETTQVGTPPIDRTFFDALANGKSVDEAIEEAKQNASQITLAVYPTEGGNLHFIPLKTVDFSRSCETPAVGQEVTFTQDTVTPANAQIAKWEWNFGDGSPVEESTFLPASSTNEIKHTYTSSTEDPSKPGFSPPFPVSLTVTDLFGHKVKQEKQMRLASRSPRDRLTAGAGSCPIPPPPDEIRVKVIMTYSEDPNDVIASRLYNVHLLIGSTDAVIGDEDNIARVTVAPGTYVIKFPQDNGLDDENGNHLYRVGSVNVHVTKNGDSGTRCAPNSQEGDVVWTFDTSASNPDALSEYEVAPRIVPYDAPALENGASCQ